MIERYYRGIWIAGDHAKLADQIDELDDRLRERIYKMIGHEKTLTVYWRHDLSKPVEFPKNFDRWDKIAQMHEPDAMDGCPMCSVRGSGTVRIAPPGVVANGRPVIYDR